jgi:hypothetical protein
MADCARFEATYQKLLAEYNSINGTYRTIEAQGISAAKSFNFSAADAAADQLQYTLERRANSLSGDANIAKQDAEDAGCQNISNQLDDLESRFDDLVSNIQDAYSNVDDAISDAEDAKEEADEAAKAKEDELQEVSVTGKKAPAAVNEPTSGDGLEEVAVTGKKAPTPIDKNSDPGAKADSLEEVTVTGKRATDPAAGNTNRGLSGSTKNTRAQATLQDTTNFKQRKDWRVRLALSPGAQQAKYLYYSDTPGILAPLQATDGVIFPYTPTINVTYGANYNSVLPAHSNYKIFQYESSFVDTISITCDFTAQDTDEANYILAVIHFFRSVTKMFYGQDEFPKPGTPPPLCYLFGLGEFQFNAQPLAITNFTYNLPPDVDYIRAGAITAGAGVNRSPSGDPKKPKKTNPFQAVAERLAQNAVSKLGGTAQTILKKVIPGGKLAGPDFNGSQNNTGFNSTIPPGTKDPTYVPTKINISISAVPIVSRYDISNRFSVKDYASGKLLNGVKQAGGGMW